MPSKKLSPCPNRPNCVSSEATAGRHFIEPYVLAVDTHQAWQVLQTLIADLPRTAVRIANDTYIHAESKSRLFGFVDDVEFLLQPKKNQIAIRSASRTGYSDLGVNRKRLEILRRKLQTLNVIR